MKAGTEGEWNVRRPPRIVRLVSRIVEGDGFCETELRKRVFERASFPDASDAGNVLAPEISRIVHKIARHAYRVVDEDFDALREGGLSDDEIFEIVVCAAVGAAHARFSSGLRALEELEEGLTDEASA